MFRRGRKSIKIVLINPPDLNSLEPKLDVCLGLLYLSSNLKKNGFECEILDLAFYDKSQWKSLIESHPAELYGMTVYSSTVYTTDIINKLIKGCHPNSKIVLGGTHVTFCAVDYITQFPEADFIIFNEGEEVLLELCQKFNSPHLYGSISGLATHQGNLLFISNMRPPIKNLDSIPPPDREGVPLHNYTRTVNGIKSSAIMTSRGCYGFCKFCCSHYFWKYPRFHSAERVHKELQILHDMNFKAFHDWSDIFTMNPNLNKILDSVKHFGFTFRCNGDLRRDTKEILQKIYDSGCREIGFGVESGDQKVLDIIGKGTTVERNKQVLKWAKEIGLPIKAYLMCGLPGETIESIRKTIDFVKEIEPDYYTISNLVPFPGSDMYVQPEKYGIKFRTKNWDEYFVVGRKNQGGCVIDTKEMTAEQIAEAREMLIAELPKQTGKLQDYYKKAS